MTTFEPAMLPDEEKLRLCEDLLNEFGVPRWRKTTKGELIHSCPLPGAHRNGDKSPSASLNFRKLTFNCFGCGSRGGLLWFMATMRGADAQGVREWLSEATGTGGREMDLGKLLELVDAFLAPSAPPPPIPRHSERTLDPWTWGIQHPYLTLPLEEGGRGCQGWVLDEFRVGYAPDYSMGPTRPTQERITIPLFWKGDLVGWQARRLDEDDEPKYINSVDFPRDRTVYGYHPYVNAVVVESPLSVLRHHHHVPEMLSTLGAEVTEAQTRLLHRYSRIVLWYDPDPSGWDATEALGEALLNYCEVSVVDNPYDADPADLDDATAKELIGGAIPFSIWTRPDR